MLSLTTTDNTRIVINSEYISTMFHVGGTVTITMDNRKRHYVKNSIEEILKLIEKEKK